MEQYKVEITKEALQDMEDMYNYIALELLSPENAMGQYNRIADEILTLDTFPQRYRLMDSEPEKQMELRRMIVDNYSVFYTIRADKVIVTDVLYTASAKIICFLLVDKFPIQFLRVSFLLIVYVSHAVIDVCCTVNF